MIPKPPIRKPDAEPAPRDTTALHDDAGPPQREDEATRAPVATPGRAHPARRRPRPLIEPPPRPKR